MSAFPLKSWAAYEADLRQVGERRNNVVQDGFLADLGLTSTDGSLTTAGNEYFQLKFIQRKDDEARTLLADRLLDHPPVTAICQLLDGVPGTTKENVDTVLRSQGFGEGLTDRKLGSLLTLMKSCGLISVSKGEIRILVSPAKQAAVPTSVFISRQTPFGNKIWLRRILEECGGFIYWIDKHFMPMAFEPLWEAADGTRISEVKILSLDMPDKNTTRRGKNSYKDLKTELRNRGIELEWRLIDSTLLRDTHDRWIIGASTARNVPDVQTIFSGNHSEFNRSDQAAILKPIFDGYWTQAVPVS